MAPRHSLVASPTNNPVLQVSVVKEKCETCDGTYCSEFHLQALVYPSRYLLDHLELLPHVFFDLRGHSVAGSCQRRGSRGYTSAITESAASVCDDR